jgi:hypothetical protein
MVSVELTIDAETEMATATVRASVTPQRRLPAVVIALSEFLKSYFQMNIRENGP